MRLRVPDLGNPLLSMKPETQSLLHSSFLNLAERLQKELDAPGEIVFRNDADLEAVFEIGNSQIILRALDGTQDGIPDAINFALDVRAPGRRMLMACRKPEGQPCWVDASTPSAVASRLELFDHSVKATFIKHFIETGE